MPSWWSQEEANTRIFKGISYRGYKVAWSIIPATYCLKKGPPCPPQNSSRVSVLRSSWFRCSALGFGPKEVTLLAQLGGAAGDAFYSEFRAREATHGFCLDSRKGLEQF